MGQGGRRFRELAGFDLVKPGRTWLEGDGEDVSRAGSILSAVHID